MLFKIGGTATISKEEMKFAGTPTNIVTTVEKEGVLELIEQDKNKAYEAWKMEMIAVLL